MTLVCVFAYVVYEPASALADQIRSDNELTENIDTINSIWENEPNAYSPLVGELTEERDEDVKRFRRADGSYEIVAYSDPVHYMVNGEWAAIDNTLVYDAETGRFINTANDLIIELASGIEKDSPVYTISYNGETITMTGMTLPGITDREGTITGIPAERERKDELTDEEHDMLLRFPEELSSSLAYYTEDGNEIGFEYKLSGKSLYEYITLFERPEEAPAYTYTFTTTLSPRLEGNAVFFENEAGEVVLYFSAPVMRDAKDNECFEFEVAFEQNEDGSYTYTLMPDEAWLMSDETVYPVVIDPDVNVNFKNNVQNSYISSSNPDFAYGSNSNTKYSLKVGGSAAYRTLIRLENLQQLAPGDVVISASVNLTRFGTSSDQYGKEIDAYRMNGTWDESTVTWNIYSAINGGNPYDSSRIETLALSSYAETQTVFDITDLYKKWYAGTTPNHGLLLTSGNYACFYSSRNSDKVSAHPYFSVVYINSTGLESRFSYSSQSAGRAGTGSVNLYSGNLTMSFADAEITNGTMPISLSHTYNTNDKETDIGYGYGWRLNYSQEINEVEITDRNNTQTYFELVDGDGTRHYYKKKSSSSSVYVNELDKDSELTINTSANEITIKDKGDNKLVFKYGTVSGKKLGRLIRIEDANGNKTLIEYTTTTVIGSDDKQNLRISSITEKLAANTSNGQSITLSYSNNRLSAITVPNGLNRTYTYSSGNLTQVGSTDSKTCYYTYSSHKITKAKNIDNYNLNYTYDDLSRVISVQEEANTTAGNSLTYDYGWNVTTVTDNQDRSTIYQFNNSGQAVSVMDNEGNAVYAAFNTAEQTTTQLAAVSKVQHTVINLLKNSSFDDSNFGNWSIYGGSGCTIYAAYPHTGRYTLKLLSGGYADQTVSVTAGSTYTLSAYFTGEEGGKVQVYNGSSLLAESDVTDLTVTPGSSWLRRSATFTVPSGVSSVTVRIAKVSGGSTNTYIDTVQLEEGNTPNRANLITNGDFSNALNSFDSTGFQTGDGVVSCSDSTHPSYLSSSVLKIEGSMLNEFVKQTLFVTGKKGDTYSFGGWCSSDSVPMGYQINYGSGSIVLCGEKSITITFYNNSTYVNKATLYFAADTTDWQFASSSAVAGGAYTKIEVSVRFCQSRNNAYFDGIQLYREEFSQGYEYDANGNLKKYTSLISQENDFQYDNDDNLTSAKDARGNTTAYTYDSKHNLLTTTTPENVVTTNTYDTNGNVTQTQVGNSTDYIKASTTYDSASALATAVTDARGNSVQYGYDITTRQQTTITDPNTINDNINNNTDNYTSSYDYYDAASMLRLASLTSYTGTGNNTATVNYSYDQYGKLTSIQRGTTSYNFTYDAWGRVTRTKVGTMTLSQNTYDAYGRLSSVNCGNGLITSYVYDSLDRTSKIYQRNTIIGQGTLSYEFIYNGEGDLYELRNYKTNRATFFEYDHSGRCMASTEKSFTVTNDVISYTGTLSSYRYEYDPNNNLTKLTCSVNGSVWDTTYTYDKDNRPTSALLHNGRSIVNTYDTIGRITSRAIKNGSTNILKTDLTYISGANGSKTALVASYKNGNDDAYSYTYDANGNITSIIKGSMSFTYEYDKANQLVRENLYYGAGNTNNATYTYTYDLWGNILQKNKYAYTTGTVGTVQDTVTYGYTDSQWGDKLTSYNGSIITYDSMGNPKSYLGKTLSWEGKQLTGYANGNDSVSYIYNEDGLRLRKTVNNETTEYCYNGSVLIGMKMGSGSTAKVLRFSYDASGNVVAVDYSTNNGSSFTTYYYVRNAQNDIVKLIDGSGNTKVEYLYDSWGKPISVTGTMASTLGADQPFRYRGYVYDNETQWYYLQSRYYDPTICRFISADVLLSTGQGVIGHDSFAYCLNNPTVNLDKTGTSSASATAYWTASMWWICAVDLHLPIGDIVYVVGIVVCAAIDIVNYIGIDRIVYIFDWLYQHAQKLYNWAMQQSSSLKNIYNSARNCPDYPNDFRRDPNGFVKHTVKNKQLLNELRQIEKGKWWKVYEYGRDGMGRRIELHYFLSKSGKVFDFHIVYK